MDLGELREKEKQIKKDIEDEINTKVANSAPLNDMFEQWIEMKKGLRGSTREKYKAMHKRYVEESIGQKKVANLVYADIFNFYRHLAEDKGFAKGYLEFVDNVVVPSFDYAVKMELSAKIPVSGYLRKLQRIFASQQKKWHSLTIQEQNAFINYVENSPIYSLWLPMFTLFLGTGGRCGEILGLRWDDVDFDNNTILINHALTYYPVDGKSSFHIHDRKTASGNRIIPMMKK